MPGNTRNWDCGAVQGGRAFKATCGRSPSDGREDGLGEDASAG